MGKSKIDSLSLTKAKATERDTFKNRALERMKSTAWLQLRAVRGPLGRAAERERARVGQKRGGEERWSCYSGSLVSDVGACGPVLALQAPLCSQ